MLNKKNMIYIRLSHSADMRAEQMIIQEIETMKSHLRPYAQCVKLKNNTKRKIWTTTLER